MSIYSSKISVQFKISDCRNKSEISINTFAYNSITIISLMLNSDLEFLLFGQPITVNSMHHITPMDVTYMIYIRVISFHPFMMAADDPTD